MTVSLTNETPDDLVNRLESIQSRLISLLTHCNDIDTTCCFYLALEPITLALSQLSDRPDDSAPFLFSANRRLEDLDRLLSHAEPLSSSANGVWHAALARVSQHIADGWYPLRKRPNTKAPYETSDTKATQTQEPQTDVQSITEDATSSTVAPSWDKLGVESSEPDDSSQVSDTTTISSGQKTTETKSPPAIEQQPETSKIKDPFDGSNTTSRQVGPHKDQDCNGLTNESQKRDCQAAKQLYDKLWKEWDYIESHEMEPIDWALSVLSVGFGLHFRKALLTRAHRQEHLDTSLLEKYTHVTLANGLPDMPTIPHGVDAEHARRATMTLLAHRKQLDQWINAYRAGTVDTASMKRLTAYVQVLLNAIVPLDQQIPYPALSDWIAVWEEISRAVKAPAMHREVRSPEVRDVEERLHAECKLLLSESNKAEKVDHALDTVAQYAIDLEYQVPDATENLIKALIRCKALNIPSTHKELREILADCATQLTNPKVAPEWCEGMNLTEANVRKYICDIIKAIQDEARRQFHNGHRPLPKSVYESRAKTLCEGKRMLVISFHRNHERPDRLKERLGFAEVDWPDLDSHDNSTDIKQLVAGHDLVVVDVRGCRTHWSKAIPGYCEQEGIQCIRLPRGVGIGHMSQMIVESQQSVPTHTDETAPTFVTL